MKRRLNRASSKCRWGIRSFQKVLLLVVVLISFWFIRSVDATTYYVDCDVGSSGDGSSWAQAFKTIGEGENAATQPGDIVEISDCTYSESVTAEYAGVILKASTEVGHNDEVIINATTNGFLTVKDNITLQNVTIIGGDVWFRGAVRAAGNNFTASNIIVHDFAGDAFYFDGASNFSVSNSHIYGDNKFYALNGTTGIVQYSIFRGSNLDSGNALFYATDTGTNVNLYNSVLVGSNRWIVYASDSASLTIRNSFIGGSGREETANTEHYSIYQSSSATVDVDYSVVNGFGFNPHNYNIIDSGVTIGSNVSQNTFPYFNGWTTNESIFTITVDDKQHLDNANNLSQVLDDYGLNLTYFLHGTHYVTSSEWDTIKDMWSRGHDIGSHTRHHPHLSQDEAITLTYSGSDTNVNATVSNNATQFQINTTEGNDNVGPLNLTSASYNTLNELCTYLNGLSNYACSLVDETNWSSGVYSTSLADNSTNLTDNAAHNISYDTRMPTAGGRYFTDELSNSKSDIETGIGNGYVVKSLGYPGQDHDSVVRAAVKDAEYEVARGHNSYSTADHLLENISDIYQTPITKGGDTIRGLDYDTLSSVEKEARIRGFAQAYATFALENGVWASVIIHGADSFNTTELGWLVDELVDNGITIMSMREAIEYIKANWTTADNVTYTRTYSDSSNYTLKSTSSLIDAATDVGLTTDFAGNLIYGTPDIGAYEYQPPYTIGTDKINVSGNIRIYADGKYRYINASSGIGANLTVIPSTGWPTNDYSQWMDLYIETWNVTDDYYKKWNETCSNSSSEVNHTIGDFPTNTRVMIKKNSAYWNTFTSNSSGYINFNYDEGFSTITFEAEQAYSDGSSCTYNGECLGGYCVHGICRSTPNYCGDGYCDSSEDCSSCPADCGVCPSGGGYPTFKPTQERLEEGYEKSLRENWKIQFELNNETHAIKLDDIINKTAIITVSSEPITFNLTVNETKKLNLDDDNYYDLQVFLKDISDYEADLIVKLIREEILRICEPDWECPEWSGCINYTQTRICTDLNNCNTTEGKPDEVKSCCEPDWECSEWSECVNNIQTRICTDLNNCNVTEGKPDEVGECEPEADYLNIVIISLLIVAIVIAGFLVRKQI